LKSLSLLEKEIGYTFKNRDLLLNALTHSSYANENSLPAHSDNERLEFLGDSVLELLSSDFLYRNYPDRGEGELSKLRASLVCEMALSDIAKKLSLGKLIRLSAGEEKTGGRQRNSILSDALEAVIGAIYLDGGIEPAKAFVENVVLPISRTEGFSMTQRPSFRRGFRQRERSFSMKKWANPVPSTKRPLS